MSRVSEAERRARAALTRISEPGDVGLGALVVEHGAERVVEGLRAGETFGRPEAAAWRVRLDDHDPDRDLERAAAAGARLICPGDAEWPHRLEDLVDVLSLDRRTVRRQDRATQVRRGGVPVALWARGSAALDAVSARSVAIVGSRAASAYGSEVSGEVAYGVGRHGVTVVSGAAYGVDAAAHRGALAAEAPTVAVLACGVDVSYPRGHAALLDRIADEGLVLSEVPPRSAPSRIRFLTRNRLIAAMTCGTVIVEAAVRSGALNTARWAAQLMRPVMGVPGPVTSAMSAGVHEMFRSGLATVVTEGAEVLETISGMGENLLPFRYGESRPRDELDDVTAQVLEAVPSMHAVGLERVARTAGLPLHETELKLGRLLLQDFVEQVGERWRLSEASRADISRRRSSAT